MKARAIISILAFVFAAVSCVRPVSDERFICRSSLGADSAYVFTLDFADTLVSYDLWFYTAFDHPVADTLSGGFRIDVRLVNPVPDTLSETVYMRYGAPGGFKELYRSGLVPAVPGQWTLEARTPGAPAQLRGLGLVCKRNDGTR